MVIVAVHAAAVISTCAGIAVGSHIVTVTSVLLAVLCWLYTLFAINSKRVGITPPAELKIVESFSVVSYVLAYPLIFDSTNQIERILGMVMFFMHIITVPMIAILFWATELHDAWGCYGSQQSLSAYDKGMCGQWNVDQIEICRDLQKKKPPNTDCSSETTTFDFFGVLLHRIVQLQIISLTFWIHSMTMQYYQEKKKTVKEKSP